METKQTPCADEDRVKWVKAPEQAAYRTERNCQC